MTCNHEAHTEEINGLTVDRCGKCGAVLWVYAPTLTRGEKWAAVATTAVMLALSAAAYWL